MSQNLSRVAPFLFGRRPFIAALVRTFHSSSSVYRSTLANSGSLASPVRGGHQPYQEGRPWSPCVKAAVSFASLSVALLSASAPVASCEEYGEDNTDFRGVFKSLESSVVLLYASPQGGNPPGTQIGTAFVYKEEKGRTYLISAAHTLRKRIGFAQGGVDPRLGDVLWVKLPVSGRWEEVKLEGKTEGDVHCYYAVAKCVFSSEGDVAVFSLQKSEELKPVEDGSDRLPERGILFSCVLCVYRLS